MDLSIVLPVYNEEKNISLLYEKLDKVLKGLNKSYEIIFVNDGSKDNSYDELVKIAENDKNVKIINLRKNFGQTAAMAAGIDYSIGEIIILMDSDLQNDPEDIPALIDKINEGYDVVSGWRKKRKDPLFSRKIPSFIANLLIKKISNVNVKDLGCSLKAYKKDVLKSIRLYGDMHRFIPIYASWVGAKITDLPVKHHPRQFGKSKYGISRTFKVIIDLFAMKFLGSYSTKPMHFFGKIAGLHFIFAILWSFIYLYRVIKSKKFLTDESLVLIFLFWALTVLFIGFGLLAEVMVRVYHESQNKPTYIIKDKINFDK
ncbi:MAG TPA: glycosyltransferase family 2 protein [Spirochaetota bacterium]|nr:glycosyltransferase family 2 protein [Spirochaetota bacterium]HOM38114.1 glycosyltransferase family 2 protein [Spirochaetota bacterium]HPQ48916.1 glycosyltransferase family 2 protein [Spirochaetota bacterium]